MYTSISHSPAPAMQHIVTGSLSHDGALQPMARAAASDKAQRGSDPANGRAFACPEISSRQEQRALLARMRHVRSQHALGGALGNQDPRTLTACMRRSEAVCLIYPDALRVIPRAGAARCWLYCMAASSPCESVPL